jgi:hypothetical protein
MSGQSYTRIFWDTNGEYIGHWHAVLEQQNPRENGFLDVKKEKEGC